MMAKASQTVWGGVEGGGTKFVCALGSDPDHILVETQIATRGPEETLAEVAAFFGKEGANQSVGGIGVGSFGPVDLDPKSPTYGYITSTPKAGWRNIDVAGTLGKALKLPIAFGMDVGAAALGEHTWGAAQGLTDFIYLTVGTGIGAGVMANGELLRGLVHPEVGHLLIPHDKARDPFSGACPFHGDCLEGLASGPAMLQRWGQPAETLPVDHEAWALEAEYLAYALTNFILAYSPQRIIIGGGVLSQAQLLPKIQTRVRALLGGYVRNPKVEEGIGEYIVKPQLGNKAGVLGAIAMVKSLATI